MSHLIADGSLLEKLSGLKEPVEFRDSNGKVLGLYTPVLSPEMGALHAKASKLFDLEEAKRDAAAGQGRGVPLDEVMRQLQSLEK